MLSGNGAPLLTRAVLHMEQQVVDEACAAREVTADPEGYPNDSSPLSREVFSGYFGAGRGEANNARGRRKMRAPSATYTSALNPYSGATSPASVLPACTDHPQRRRFVYTVPRDEEEANAEHISTVANASKLRLLSPSCFA